MFKTARNLIALGIGLGTSAVVGWLLLKESKRQQESGAVTVSSHRRSGEEESPPAIKLPLETLEEAAPAPTEEEPDDFTQINGIGPRYAEALAEALAPYVRVRAERISDKDWIGQAARLAQ